MGPGRQLFARWAQSVAAVRGWALQTRGPPQRRRCFANAGRSGEQPGVREGFGRALCGRQGQFLKYSTTPPFANVFVPMLERMRLPVERFADSSGGLDELIA